MNLSKKNPVESVEFVFPVKLPVGGPRKGLNKFSFPRDNVEVYFRAGYLEISIEDRTFIVPSSNIKQLELKTETSE